MNGIQLNSGRPSFNIENDRPLPSLEPNLLERIWQAVLAAFETLIGWISSFFSWICGGEPTASVASGAAPAAPANVALSATPAVVSSSTAPAAPVRNPAHFAKDLFVKIWNRLLEIEGEEVIAANAIEPLVAEASQSQSTEFPQVRVTDLGLVVHNIEVEFRERGTNHGLEIHNRDTMVARLKFEALWQHLWNRPRIYGALLTKGEETHLLLIDCRDHRALNPVYYHISQPNLEIHSCRDGQISGRLDGIIRRPGPACTCQLMTVV